MLGWVSSAEIITQGTKKTAKHKKLNEIPHLSNTLSRSISENDFVIYFSLIFDQI